MKRLTNSIAWAVIAAPLLLFALSSCRSTLEPDPSGGDDGILSPDVTTLKLSFGDGPSGDDPDSKVTIRSTTGKFLWSKDDRVMVWHAPDPENPSTGGSWALSSTIKAEEQVHVTPNNSGDVRCAVAIYPPESAVPGSCTTINYPTSYDLAGKGDEYVPVPMIAKNDANRAGLRFYHAGALLRFRIYAVPAGTKTLEVSFTDRNGDPLDVTGEFAFSMDAGDSFATTGPAGSNGNTVTLTLTDAENGLSADVDGLVINVPVPVSTIGGFEIKAYDKDHSLTILEGDKITQVQLNATWAWDAHRALGLEKDVCFGYHPPQNPIIGATDASHKFSVGPGKYVYIARSALAYFGESFPDSPWRLEENSWGDNMNQRAYNGKTSDFNTFHWGTSGYVPEGKGSLYGAYLPWGNELISGPQTLDEFDIIYENPSTYPYYFDTDRDPANHSYINLDTILRPKDMGYWDWGLYNGRPDGHSNPYNPNPTGLWTYDGQEMEGEWRIPALHELQYLFGLIPYQSYRYYPDLMNLEDKTFPKYSLVLSTALAPSWPVRIWYLTNLPTEEQVRAPSGSTDYWTIPAATLYHGPFFDTESATDTRSFRIFDNHSAVRQVTRTVYNLTNSNPSAPQDLEGVDYFMLRTNPYYDYFSGQYTEDEVLSMRGINVIWHQQNAPTRVYISDGYRYMTNFYGLLKDDYTLIPNRDKVKKLGDNIARIISDRRRNGKCLWTHVSLYDEVSGREEVRLVLLPDNWDTTENPDPLKNRASGSNGALQLELSENDARQNSYSFPAWRFFMESHGAVMFSFNPSYQYRIPISDHTNSLRQIDHWEEYIENIDEEGNDNSYWEDRYAYEPIPARVQFIPPLRFSSGSYSAQFPNFGDEDYNSMRYCVRLFRDAN